MANKNYADIPMIEYFQFRFIRARLYIRSAEVPFRVAPFCTGFKRAGLDLRQCRGWICLKFPASRILLFPVQR
jgi:hypothetical protein